MGNYFDELVSFLELQFKFLATFLAFASLLTRWAKKENLANCLA